MIDTKANKQSSSNRLSFIAMLITSFVFGILTQRCLLQKETTISYISQSQLLELEKARLKGEDLPNRQLFLGQPATAIKLIEEIQAKRTSAHNIVLISEKAIFGKNVKSISDEVHKEILQNLGASKKND